MDTAIVKKITFLVKFPLQITLNGIDMYSTKE